MLSITLDKSALSTFSGFIQTTFGRKQAYKICKNLNADALNLGSNVVIQGNSLLLLQY